MLYVDNVTMDIPSDVYDVFIRSCFEQLADIETRILDLEQHSQDEASLAAPLDAIIRPAHSIKADAASIGLTSLVTLAHAVESVLIRCRENKHPITNYIADMLLVSFDRIRYLIRTGNTEPNPDVSSDVNRLEQILLTPQPVEDAVIAPTVLDDTSVVSSDAQSIDWMHVPAEKMDMLVDYVGEMLVLNSRLNALVGRSGVPELSVVAEQIESLGGVIRDQVMDMRLMPVGIVFSRFRRMVRDLATRLGKQVDFRIVGDDTELDKTVIEQMCPLLSHLLRNAVDHGIEPPEKRRAVGKSETGTIYLKTVQDGGDVVVSVSDDGAGVDLAVLTKKATDMGYCLLTESDMDEQKLVDLIFLPGVSQCATANDVSGRGMGMSAVRQAVRSLRGTMTVESTPGKGVLFSLRLPLSMTLFLGLEVNCANSGFLFHLESVVECLEESQVELGPEGRGIMNYRGQPLPVLSLRHFFRLGVTLKKPYQIVVVEAALKRYAVVVDCIIGQKKAVFQKMSPALGQVDGVAGMSMTGDGGISLVLDMARIADIIVGDTKSAIAR